MIGFAVIVGAQMVQTAASGIRDVEQTFSPGSEAAGIVQRYRAAPSRRPRVAGAVRETRHWIPRKIGPSALRYLSWARGAHSCAMLAPDARTNGAIAPEGPKPHRPQRNCDMGSPRARKALPCLVGKDARCRSAEAMARVEQLAQAGEQLMVGTVERAHQLAPECRTIDELRARLAKEHCLMPMPSCKVRFAESCRNC